MNKPVQKAEELENYKVEFESGQTNVRVSDGVTGEIMLGVNTTAWHNNEFVRGATTNIDGVAAITNLPEK